MNIISESDFPKFISKATHKTPKARVVVTSLTFDNKGYVYEIPSGFQYDKYLSWRYPDFTIECRCTDDGWEAKVAHKEHGLLEIHTGVYILEDGDVLPVLKYGSIHIHKEGEAK